jgi:hypothetical protein
VTGAVNGDTINWLILTSAASNVGVTQSTLGNNPNYNITPVNEL